MTFKKTIGKLHLWLGLASGIIVVWLGITGCILAFEREISDATQPYRFVEETGSSYLPPTVLKDSADQYLNGKETVSIEYLGTRDAALAYYYDEEVYYQIFVNPYTGHVQKVKDMSSDFFRIITMGHYELWLGQTGRMIISTATLIFLIMMITGIILWWPKNKAAAKQRFRLKWKPTTKWRRKNYDIHNVFGFYMTWIAIFLAITGLVMGFEWFSNSVYFVTSGGKTMPEHVHPLSDSTLAGTVNKQKMVNTIWLGLMKQKKTDNKVGIVFPHDHADALEGYVNHNLDSYFNADFYHYDQYTGKELPTHGVYAGKFETAPLSDKIARMNYDIHVGAVLGLPGKILAFFASLIAASLPITGFLIWRGRKKNQKKRNPIQQTS
ncbi:PepSY-associated TM helix domain-containing protein [Niabella hibiscisoli]|uniref:PepSY-associated TM helix domain-containing protein n=1 Tax=Niabella hibiscisoli TaxID=1825928 RepID=UPI001F0F31A2|nr:PepSY-associated TM helix domain-containing protein [Niabella hibiscisoli]MCH5717695.1 PepSY domain-containing protein [Niabella hibiscisoli]